MLIFRSSGVSLRHDVSHDVFYSLLKYLFVALYQHYHSTVVHAEYT